MTDNYIEQMREQYQRDKERGEKIFSELAQTMYQQSHGTSSTPASVPTSKRISQKESSIPTAQEFEKMGYKERAALQSKSPEVYERLQRQSWEPDGERGKAFLEGFNANY